MDAIRTLGWRTEEGRGRHSPPLPPARVCSNESYFPLNRGFMAPRFTSGARPPSAAVRKNQVPTSPLRVGERPTVAPNGRCRPGRGHSPIAQIQATGEPISPLCEPFKSADLNEQKTL
ncbi:hypothetical protein R1CP_37305 (plasmid) [Rhodococcus opacus]|uniref:Uncharacterized protein n=1 Tax=Rhodococcus opacus TaxID=37919 RepID=A0A1B1KHH6_RHOOP|nr:hypothetical protein R1CP_37305 [Rhodococcus opacus]